MSLLEKIFGSYSKKELQRIEPLVQAVMDKEEHYKAMSDSDLKAMTPALKQRLADGETLDDILVDAYAVCREAAWRVLEMKHFRIQVVGGIILHQGRIAEMRTGEGKTLVSTLPAYLNALGGKGVHIVTVNDYLAKRDSELMGKMHRWLGLTVGLAISGMNPDDKKIAYDCDITYATNNELGFDYLRDNMAVYKHNMVQRGTNFAIVDEVDSILVDEARTPLIISGQGDNSSDLYKIVDAFARTLSCLRIKETDTKEEVDDVDADYIVDEKARTATITPNGAKKAESRFKLDSLNDPENLTLAHHINQAIKAHGTMEKDVDYVVKDDEVIIVDDFTGRLMVGRRYNEGLHQAIEAKEGVKIQKESKTLATITFQNYFRMYDKLCGMTGTAMTEEGEFREIYKLDVVEIPTNKPIQRIDNDDVVYKTQNGKYNAAANIVAECHAKGQPILVGTVSIERSELISKLLKKRGIKHNVLNAKLHEKEAEIIAQAGKYGAVTIATNMAGRGTDIILGGNAEYMAIAQLRREEFSEQLIYEATSYSDTNEIEIINARKRFQELLCQYKAELAPEAEKVRDAGGLYILGTERHESRRIDNQLRGRSGRQGDPGDTRFIISLEDDLMRLFGGERVQGLMDNLGLDENEPIENKFLTNSIQSSQSKIEGRNFQIRKNVLQYDDVMNRQREIIYSQRLKVLNGEDISAGMQTMIDDVAAEIVKKYVFEDNDKDSWNLRGLCDFGIAWNIFTQDDLKYDNLDDVSQADIIEFTKTRIKNILTEKENIAGSNIMREAERMILLQNVDKKWMAHIDDMEQLKRGIGLRSYAQRNPVIEYRVEGFEMFDYMNESIKEDTVRGLINIRFQVQRAAPQAAPTQAQPKMPEDTQLPNDDKSDTPPAQPAQQLEEIKRVQVAQPTTTSHGDGSVSKRPVKSEPKVGRNDPCPCGSGKKHKKCCGQ